MEYIQAIEKEALDKWPCEMVGYVKDDQFYPLRNISKSPKDRYQLSIQDTLFVLNNEVDFLVHSHPTLDNQPSQKDLMAQKSTNIPFLIIGTDGTTCTDLKEVS